MISCQMGRIWNQTQFLGVWDNIHALDLVEDFHQKHSRAPQCIHFTDFNDITFYLNPLLVVLGCHSLEGGG